MVLNIVRSKIVEIPVVKALAPGEAYCKGKSLPFATVDAISCVQYHFFPPIQGRKLLRKSSWSTPPIYFSYLCKGWADNIYSIFPLSIIAFTCLQWFMAQMI